MTGCGHGVHAFIIQMDDSQTSDSTFPFRHENVCEIELKLLDQIVVPEGLDRLSHGGPGSSINVHTHCGRPTICISSKTYIYHGAITSMCLCFSAACDHRESRQILASRIYWVGKLPGTHMRNIKLQRSTPVCRGRPPQPLLQLYETEIICRIKYWGAIWNVRLTWASGV